MLFRQIYVLFRETWLPSCNGSASQKSRRDTVKVAIPSKCSKTTPRNDEQREQCHPPVLEVLRKNHSKYTFVMSSQVNTNIPCYLPAETTQNRREVSLNIIQGVQDPSSILLGDFELSLMYVFQAYLK